MTYYNCAKFHCCSIFNFGVSRGQERMWLFILSCRGSFDPTNISKNTLGFLGLSSHVVQCFLRMLPGDSEDSDWPIRTLKCLSSAGTNSMGLAVRLVNLCSIFVSNIINFVTLTKNMTVINVVHAGTDIKSIGLM